MSKCIMCGERGRELCFSCFSRNVKYSESYQDCIKRLKCIGLTPCKMCGSLTRKNLCNNCFRWQSFVGESRVACYNRLIADNRLPGLRLVKFVRGVV